MNTTTPPFNKELWNKTREHIKTHPEEFNWEFGDETEEHGGCICCHICKCAGKKVNYDSFSDAALLLKLPRDLVESFREEIWNGYKRNANDNITAVVKMDEFHAKYLEPIL